MPKKILIVDDNTEASELTQMALSMIDRNISTERVFSGEQALEFLRTTPDLPAMILTDLKMPGIGGIETLRRIRADERLKHIPVVMTTFWTFESDIKEAYRAGVSGFVNKEFSLEEFSKNLEQHVKKWM